MENGHLNKYLCELKRRSQSTVVPYKIETPVFPFSHSFPLSYKIPRAVPAFCRLYSRHKGALFSASAVIAATVWEAPDSPVLSEALPT